MKIVEDMINEKVIQPSLVTISALKLATEVVRMILKIDDIVIGRFMEMDALPLSAHPVVGKIVEHIVDTVASQHDIVVGLSLNQQFSMHFDASVFISSKSVLWVNHDCVMLR